MTVDNHIALLNDAHERCKLAFAAVEAAHNAVQQGTVDSDLALNSAMENLKRACDHFDLAHNNAMRYINIKRMRMGPVPSNQCPTAAEPAPVRPVVTNVRPVAVHRTVAEPAPIRPVVADVPEEHKTAASVRPDLDPNIKG